MRLDRGGASLLPGSGPRLPSWSAATRRVRRRIAPPGSRGIRADRQDFRASRSGRCRGWAVQHEIAGLHLAGIRRCGGRLVAGRRHVPEVPRALLSRKIPRRVSKHQLPGRQLQPFKSRALPLIFRGPPACSGRSGRSIAGMSLSLGTAGDASRALRGRGPKRRGLGWADTSTKRPGLLLL